MDGQTERKCDGVGQCTPSNCRQPEATLPSILPVAGIVGRCRMFCSKASPLDVMVRSNLLAKHWQGEGSGKCHGSSSEFRSEIY